MEVVYRRFRAEDARLAQRLIVEQPVLGMTITEGGRTSSRLVATTNGVTQPGDSGAPWFNGTVAFGSHVGSATIRGQVRSLFQVADLYDEALGVRVRTT